MAAIRFGDNLYTIVEKQQVKLEMLNISHISIGNGKIKGGFQVYGSISAALKYQSKRNAQN